VDTGRSGQSGNGPSREFYELAFLLATNASGFRVFDLNLAEQTYAQTNPNAHGAILPPPISQGGGFYPERVGFAVLQLSKEITEVLQVFQDSSSKGDLWWRYGGLFDDRTMAFALAWGC
jgi:hypothetical protein